MPQSTIVAPSLDPRMAYSLVDDGALTEDAFRTIDEEMKRHHDFILSLKNRRNSFAPISKLPPELLSRVFAFVQEHDSTQSKLNMYKLKVVPSWIIVSYVCRLWRNVALNHPSLWTKLPFYNRRWCAEMLSRSKNASLTVDVEYSGLTYYVHNGYERVTSALTHSSRIRHLILSNVDPARMQKFLSDMPKSTPRLETLSLSICPTAAGLPVQGTICELPTELISTTDRLRRLELTRLKFDWNSTLSESLTHLLLHDVPSSARPTQKQFWDILRKMPLLESIDLVNALPDLGSSDDDFRDGILHFPNLLSLTIKSSTPEVEGFLRRIYCSPTITLNIDSRGTSTTLHDFTGLISWLSTTLSPVKRPRGSIRTLIIKATSPSRGLQFLTSPEIATTDSLTAKKMDLSLSFASMPQHYQHIPEEIFSKMLADVAGALSLQGLVVLRLDQHGSSFSASTIKETFGSLPQLKTVIAVGSITAELITALNDTLPNQRSTRKHAERPTFPALRSISIINVDFEFDTNVTALEEMIKNRKNRGAEVRDLNLQMCSRIMQEDVLGLAKIVPKFDWDNIEMGYSDEDYHSEGYDYGGLYDSDTEYDYYDYYPF